MRTKHAGEKNTISSWHSIALDYSRSTVTQFRSAVNNNSDVLLHIGTGCAWKRLPIIQRVKRKTSLLSQLNLPLVSLWRERERNICTPASLLLIFISILLHLKHYIVSIEPIAEWAHFLCARGEIGFVSENNYNHSKWAQTHSCVCMLWSLSLSLTHTHKQMKTFRQHWYFQFVSVHLFDVAWSATKGSLNWIKHFFLLWLIVLFPIYIDAWEKKCHSLDTSCSF